MTREEAIYEISTSGDPQEYEKAINFAIEALKNDVPREKIEAMIAEIDKFEPSTNYDEHVCDAINEILAIIHKYTDQGGDDGET